MNVHVRPILAILMMLICIPAFADKDNGYGCKPTGSWIGYDETGSAWWLTTNTAQSASHGNLILQTPGAKNFFPDAYAGTEMRGVWEKFGDNMVAWTVVGFVYTEDRITLSISRLSGKATFSPDCNTEYLTDVFMEVFAPDANVETDIPLWTMEFPDHPGYRINLVTFDLP